MTIKTQFDCRRGGFHLQVDLEVPAKGITAVCGPSGCGKTTFLRAVAGLDRHAGSLVRVGDETWQDNAIWQPVHRRALGYVFQEANLFPHLSVKQNLAYGYDRISTEQRRTTPEAIAEMLDITHLLDRRVAGLSGGESQRVALGRSLAASPRLLLLDEPLASLDAAGKQSILPYLKKVPDELEIPALLVSHDVQEVGRLADHLVLMNAGKIEAEGRLNEIMTRLDLSPAVQPDAGAVLEMEVAGHDEEFDLTSLEFSGGIFQVPRLEATVGQRVRLQVKARDVSLTLKRQTETSILNVIPAKVLNLNEMGTSQYLVLLGVGQEKILARVTRKSSQVLGLKPGVDLFAQVKSLAVLM